MKRNKYYPGKGNVPIDQPFVNMKSCGLLTSEEVRRLALEGMITPFAEGEENDGIVPYGLSHVGYNVRLGTKFYLPMETSGIVDPKKPMSEYYCKGDEYVISPNSLLLCETVESFCIPDNIIAVCFGKPTYVRTGIIVNVTPFEPGWVGKPTVTLLNPTSSHIMVYANEGIAQLLFYWL